MSRQTFINELVPGALENGKKYGLFPSVMIAQACLESGFGNSALSDPPNYNLFGIKGTHNGQYVALRTAEQRSDGSVYYVTANFRKYPNYSESMEDNAKLLKNGLTWDKNFYKGTWRSVANNYKEACQWLQGRYATDVKYASKLIDIIQMYKLDQYDVAGVQVNKPVSKSEGVLNVSGKVTVTADKVYVYDEPRVKYPNYLVIYNKGEELKYDKVVVKNGYAWFEYTRQPSKQKAYMPFMPVSEVWVKF